MKTSLKIFALVLFLFAYTGLDAQSYKFGHLNSSELLQSLPATKEAEKALETFTNQWKSKLEAKYANLDSEMSTFYQRKQDGDMTMKEEEVKTAELNQLQMEAQQMEAEAQQALAQKQEELLNPILETARAAITRLAEEEGYSYIFDTSMGVVLHAEESEDVTAKVKAKLGI